MTSPTTTSRSVRVLRPLSDFLRTEAASGLLLLLTVLVAIAWANGPWGQSYDHIWETDLGIDLGSRSFTLDLRHWVNEGLMVLFFFVIGLEVKWEITEGQFRDRRRALVPVMAAAGGMLVPAMIYASINQGTETISGWGIPMATDIAIVLGVLMLAGDRVPASLKTFLLALAIVDDIGAIAVIAFFYSDHGIDLTALAAAVAIVVTIAMLRRQRVQSSVVYVVLGAAVWCATLNAGIHATIAGVVLGLLTPSRPIQRYEYIDADTLRDISSYQAASETVALARSSVSSVEWLQHLLHPWSSYVVLPLFALANAGINIDASAVNDAFASREGLGAGIGLLFGKPIGILLFSFVAIHIWKTALPEGVGWTSLAGASVLAGIGFTLSMFISDLAFIDATASQNAKLGVLLASITAGLTGFVLLRISLRQARRKGPSSTHA